MDVGATLVVAQPGSHEGCPYGLFDRRGGDIGCMFGNGLGIGFGYDGEHAKNGGMPDLVSVKRALLSVYDKTGLVELGQALAGRGVELLSTGGTARALRDAGLDVKDVSEETGFPEMMDGRVKTLHPRIHGALLGLRDNAEHSSAMDEHGIRPIDLVVCNLYPFEATVQQEGVSFEDVIEQIDIGGPSMVRSASKNHRSVAIVTDPVQYGALLSELEEHDGRTSAALRTRLARAAFARTAAYDSAIARWLAQQAGESFPATFSVAQRVAELRYGENPHQQAALYVDPMAPRGSLAAAKLLGGKAISFNNYGDVESAWALVREFDDPTCVVIKHANPCGAATAATPLDAYERAVACDPRSAFGGIVALNRPLTVDVAKAMAVKERFLEVVIAPGVDDDALAAFTAEGAPKWGKSLRVLDAGTATTAPYGMDVRSIDGGFLVQTRDAIPFGDGCPKVVTERPNPPNRRWPHALRLSRLQAHALQRHRLRQERASGRRRRGTDEPCRSNGDRGDARAALRRGDGNGSRRHGCGKRRVLSVQRRDRSGVGGGRDGARSARRIAQRRQRDRALQRARRRHVVRRKQALPALAHIGTWGRVGLCYR